MQKVILHTGAKARVRRHARPPPSSDGGLVRLQPKRLAHDLLHRERGGRTRPRQDVRDDLGDRQDAAELADPALVGHVEGLDRDEQLVGQRAVDVERPVLRDAVGLAEVEHVVVPGRAVALHGGPLAEDRVEAGGWPVAEGGATTAVEPGVVEEVVAEASVEEGVVEPGVVEPEPGFEEVVHHLGEDGGVGQHEREQVHLGPDGSIRGAEQQDDVHGFSED